MPLGSKNNFFTQDVKALEKWREELIALLIIKRCSKAQIAVVLKAYDYMVFHKDYDGSTASEDLYDLPSVGNYNGLEAASLVHDWLYLIGGMFDKKHLRMCDDVLRQISRKTNKSSWEYNLRTVKLWVLREVVNYAFWQRTLKKKNISDNAKEDVVNAYKIFKQ